MVHAPGAQARLRHGKTGAPVAQQLAGGHTHPLQQDFAVALWRVVVQHADVAHHLHARGVERHQHQAVLLVGAAGGVCLARAVLQSVAAHHDQQFAVWVCRAGDEPLAAM